MKLLDKLKNALFEEEYVEVEEKPKKKEIKKEKLKREEPKPKEKPIAKKIVQPERKELQEMEEPELLDEDFEVNPKKEKSKSEFKFPVMEDNDFEIEEKPISKEIPKKKEEPTRKGIRNPENKIVKDKKSKPYGLDDFEIPEPEHGLYEKKDERTYFKPSPIISPIYGILDKNYKKEEIKDKKEIRLTSSYAHENLDLDEVRKKAYGNLSDDIEKEFEDTKTIDMEIEEETNDSQLLDLSTDNDTPSVKKVTMGDAEEYFEDLGLEYNVDYKDISKEKATGRRVQKNYEEENEKKEEKKNIEEISNEIKNTSQDDEIDDDNLFDLIDSMYDKE